MDWQTRLKEQWRQAETLLHHIAHKGRYTAANLSFEVLPDPVPTIDCDGLYFTLQLVFWDKDLTNGIRTPRDIYEQRILFAETSVNTNYERLHYAFLGWWTALICAVGDIGDEMPMPKDLVFKRVPLLKKPRSINDFVACYSVPSRLGVWQARRIERTEKMRAAVVENAFTVEVYTCNQCGLRSSLRGNAQWLDEEICICGAENLCYMGV